jgi:hypothetical protein
LEGEGKNHQVEEKPGNLGSGVESDPGLSPLAVVVPEGGARSEAKGADRGHNHRQGGRPPLTPEAVGELVGHAAAACGFTLLEAANLGHGAASALTKVARWMGGARRAAVEWALRRYGWRLVDAPRGVWRAVRADKVTWCEQRTLVGLLRYARTLSVDVWWLAERLRSERATSKAILGAAESWKAPFLRALALASSQRALAKLCLGQYEKDTERIDAANKLLDAADLALSEAHDRAARNEEARGKAEDRAEELAVKLEQHAEDVDRLRGELEEARAELKSVMGDLAEANRLAEVRMAERNATTADLEQAREQVGATEAQVRRLLGELQAIGRYKA